MIRVLADNAETVVAVQQVFTGSWAVTRRILALTGIVMMRSWLLQRFMPAICHILTGGGNELTSDASAVRLMFTIGGTLCPLHS